MMTVTETGAVAVTEGLLLGMMTVTERGAVAVTEGLLLGMMTVTERGDIPAQHITSRLHIYTYHCL